MTADARTHPRYTRLRTTRIVEIIDALTSVHAVGAERLPSPTDIQALAQEVLDARAALLAYVRAHGNVRGLDNGLLEVEMFRAFLAACDVLEIHPSDVVKGGETNGLVADTPDYREALARAVHAGWRDGMAFQSRAVADERMRWDTLPDADKRLDLYIAGAVVNFLSARFNNMRKVRA